MSLPVRLGVGMMSIYGGNTSTQGLQAQAGLRFGVVDKIWDNSELVADIGNTVLFKVDDSVPITYSGQEYHIIDENKIILIEDTPS